MLHVEVILIEVHEGAHGAQSCGIVEPVHVVSALHHAPYLQLELLLQPRSLYRLGQIEPPVI